MAGPKFRAHGFLALLLIASVGAITFDDHSVAPAAAHHPEDEFGIHPGTLPLGPDATVFEIETAKDIECGYGVWLDHTEADLNGILYATNDPDDVCQDAAATQSRGKTLAGSSAHAVYILPALTYGAELDPTASIIANIWVWTESGGAVSPAFRLIGTDFVREVDLGASVDPLQLSYEDGETVWRQFEVDLGLAPNVTGPGGLRFEVDLGNNVGTNEVRHVGFTKSGLGIGGAYQSSIEIPFVRALTEDDDPPGPEPTWPPELADATVRPGVRHTTNGAQCTTNFVFRDRTTEKLYIGTAAHCVDNVALGGTSNISPLGGGGAVVVTVAWSSWRAPSPVRSADYALLEFAPEDEQRVHPAMLHFGGPTELPDMRFVGTLDKVITYGNSGLRLGIGPTNPHEGYVTGKNTWYTSVYTITPGIFGDSGSGIMTKNGGAIGAASTIAYAPIPGENRFSNVVPVVEWLNDNGWDLELQTWDLLNEGVLPGTFG